jgi:hypothetical protein
MMAKIDTADVGDLNIPLGQLYRAAGPGYITDARASPPPIGEESVPPEFTCSARQPRPWFLP